MTNHVRDLPPLGDIIREYWMPIAGLFAFHLLVVHFDTQWQVSEAFKDHQTTEIAARLAVEQELQRQIARLEIADAQNKAECQSTAQKLTQIQIDLERIRERQKEVRSKLRMSNGD